MIKAYHMVGSDDWESEERVEALHEIISVGEIRPAVTRLDRSSMRDECYSKEIGSTLHDKFPKAGKKAYQAMKEMVEEKLEELPESGFTQSMFNCLDLLVGDLEFVFMSLGNWYSSDNGFVFDAKQLLAEGAIFRPIDLLGEYDNALSVVVNQKYDSVKEARVEIDAMLELVRSQMEYKGRGAYKVLQACMERKGPCTKTHRPPELVWRGALPVAYAIEVWEEGKKIKG